MGAHVASSGAVGTIAAMVTPALFILAAASLVASALVRMARVTDRTRVLTAAARDEQHDRVGATPARLREWLILHQARAGHAERAIASLFLAVVFFVASCLSIALDRVAADFPAWLPLAPVVFGALLLLFGASSMVVESRLSGRQIAEEIDDALHRLERAPEMSDAAAAETKK